MKYEKAHSFSVISVCYTEKKFFLKAIFDCLFSLYLCYNKLYKV